MSDEQPTVPVNSHRKVRLLRVPTFLAQQWQSAAPGSIVGVFVDSQNNLPEEKESNKNIPSQPRKLPQQLTHNLDDKIVIISATAVASCAAKNDTRQAAAKLSQIQALGKLQALKTQSTLMSNTCLMTCRVNPENAYQQRPKILAGVSSSRELFAEQDNLLLNGMLVQDDDADDISKKIKLNGSPVSISHGLATEAEVFSTVTLIPSLDRTYHKFLRGRHDLVSQAARATRELGAGFDINTTTAKISHEAGDGSSRLFRYYRGRGGDDEDDDFDRHDEKRRRSFKQRTLTSRISEDGGASEEDGLKQRLFQLFESRNASSGSSGFSLKDLVTMTGKSPNILKGILAQIADAVRNGERRRVSYELKPEFDSRRFSS